MSLRFQSIGLMETTLNVARFLIQGLFGIIGHQLDLLYSKILRYNITSFYKLSKLVLKKVPTPHYKAQIFAGRIACDTKLLAEDMIRSKTYSLHELSKDYLQVPHLNLTPEMLSVCLQDPKSLPELVTTGTWDIICVHKLMQKLNV
ncbi:hypothetical protein Trydic_g9521, partial [Trypoxylus dichotomus]